MIRLFVFMLLNLVSCARDVPGNKRLFKDYTQQHAEALAYCHSNGLDTDYYFLIDLSIHSGSDRFFVYNFVQAKVTDKSLVTHGSCDVFEPNDNKYSNAKFSNRVDSHCSSSGKYKIGSRDYSSWGIKVKYWLEGLEETNSNARDRVVVLHSWSAVSDTEIYPEYSPLSWGCPAVSDKFMMKIDQKLSIAKKPVLLWIIK